MNISLSFLINILLFNYWCQISDQTNLLLTPFDKNSLLTDCSAQFCSTFCWTVLYWEVRISFYTTQKCVMTSQFSFILIRSSYLPTWGTPWRKKDWHSLTWMIFLVLNSLSPSEKEEEVSSERYVYFHIDRKIHNKSWLLWQ